MTENKTITVEVEFSPDEYQRLMDISSTPRDIIYESTKQRIELEEAVDYTRRGGFQGRFGFDNILNDSEPGWPLGSLLGIELISWGDGQSEFVLDADPKLANPMGTVQGGVICSLGDAALGTAYMSTLDLDESFATIDLTVHFIRPVWDSQLTANARVLHKGDTIGLVECEVRSDDEKLIARLSGTCMTLRDTSADRTTPA